jgi:hypothetical protein
MMYSTPADAQHGVAATHVTCRIINAWPDNHSMSLIRLMLQWWDWYG